MKGCAFVCFLFLLFSFFTKSAFAIVNPQESPNNKFGIHVVDENDLSDASNLVNSSGGEWGYITILIKEDDRDLNKWQNTFDRMRELKLIPLIRLATRPQGQNWEKPTISDAYEWADFLNNLNWVVENRYVIIFNEPNHAKEWGGEINPREYTEILKVFSRELKTRSPDFYILPAGLDAAAPDSKETLSITHFLDQMYIQDPHIFEYIDGWNSHSYPNPGFSASPQKKGKGSIASFDWETNYIKKLGAKSDLVVFITETGWVHNAGKSKVLGISTETVGNFYKQAYKNVWSDKRVIAVTPFVLNYQDFPFDNFSWRQLNSTNFHPHYKVVQDIQKTKGEPRQVKSAVILDSNIPKKVFSGFDLNSGFTIQNTGQTTWNPEDGYRIIVSEDSQKYVTLKSEFETVMPFEKVFVEIIIRPFYQSKSIPLKIKLLYKNEEFFETTQEIEVLDLFAFNSMSTRQFSWNLVENF